MIQNYYVGEVSPHSAIHLTVDTELTSSGDGLGVKGWVSTPLGLNPKPENCVFLPVPVQLKYGASERPARKYCSMTRSILELIPCSRPVNNSANTFAFLATPSYARDIPQPVVRPHRPVSCLRPGSQQRREGRGCRSWPIPLGRSRSMGFKRWRRRGRRDGGAAGHADSQLSGKPGQKSGRIEREVGVVATRAISEGV